MTEKLSECCGADVVKEWDVPGAVSSRIPNLYCTVCGKPCTIASQQDMIDQREIDNEAASKRQTIAKHHGTVLKEQSKPDASPDLLTIFPWFLSPEELSLIYHTPRENFIQVSKLMTLAFEAGKKASEIEQEEWQADFTEKIATKYEKRVAEIESKANEQAEKDRMVIERLRELREIEARKVDKLGEQVIKLTQALADARKQGAKELAEWANERCLDHGLINTIRKNCPECWSAKIKEIGL